MGCWCQGEGSCCQTGRRAGQQHKAALTSLWCGLRWERPSADMLVSLQGQAQEKSCRRGRVEGGASEEAAENSVENVREERRGRCCSEIATWLRVL